MIQVDPVGYPSNVKDESSADEGEYTYLSTTLSCTSFKTNFPTAKLSQKGKTVWQNSRCLLLFEVARGMVRSLGLTTTLGRWGEGEGSAKEAINYISNITFTRCATNRSYALPLETPKKPRGINNDRLTNRSVGDGMKGDEETELTGRAAAGGGWENK